MNRCLSLVVVLLVAVEGRPAAQQEASGRDWPMFRGANGTGVGTASGVPD